jgi:hypothetical protein
MIFDDILCTLHIKQDTIYTSYIHMVYIYIYITQTCVYQCVYWYIHIHIKCHISHSHIAHITFNILGYIKSDCMYTYHIHMYVNLWPNKGLCTSHIPITWRTHRNAAILGWIGQAFECTVFVCSFKVYTSLQLVPTKTCKKGLPW